eukprot:5566132-Pyramimonas_sp.AAC.1
MARTHPGRRPGSGSSSSMHWRSLRHVWPLEVLLGAHLGPSGAVLGASVVLLGPSCVVWRPC